MPGLPFGERHARIAGQDRGGGDGGVLRGTGGVAGFVVEVLCPAPFGGGSLGHAAAHALANEVERPLHRRGDFRPGHRLFDPGGATHRAGTNVIPVEGIGQADKEGIEAETGLTNQPLRLLIGGLLLGAVVGTGEQFAREGGERPQDIDAQIPLPPGQHPTEQLPEYRRLTVEFQATDLIARSAFFLRALAVPFHGGEDRKGDTRMFGHHRDRAGVGADRPGGERHHRGQAALPPLFVREVAKDFLGPRLTARYRFIDHRAPLIGEAPVPGEIEHLIGTEQAIGREAREGRIDLGEPFRRLCQIIDHRLLPNGMTRRRMGEMVDRLKHLRPRSAGQTLDRAEGYPRDRNTSKWGGERQASLDFCGGEGV